MLYPLYILTPHSQDALNEEIKVELTDDAISSFVQKSLEKNKGLLNHLRSER